MNHLEADLSSNSLYLPKVSVIVPVYNAEKTLTECIESLLKLDYPRKKLELIFVNNDSIDRTGEILDQYAGKIRIFWEKTRGAAAARNKGLLQAQGEVVAFTDSDCAAEQGWIKNIVTPLGDAKVGIAGGKILAKRPCNKIEKFGEEIHDHYKALHAFRIPYAITMNWASRLSVLREVGLFDVSFIRSQDVDLSYRIFQAGYKFAYKSEAVVFHSNRSSFGGLFREGYLHGLGSVKIHKKHSLFLKQFGHRRFSLKSYVQILSSFGDYMKGVNPDHSLCSFVFNVGKKSGRIVGSARFLHLAL